MSPLTLVACRGDGVTAAAPIIESSGKSKDKRLPYQMVFRHLIRFQPNEFSTLG